MLSIQQNLPKVSILIPLYNSSRFINETIYNCLHQTYENIEIIVVDDGSTDDSLMKARMWAAKYRNVKAYSIPNSGACSARNVAFEKCSGEYIMYLDADDKISFNKIQKQMEIIKGKDEFAVVTCYWRRFYDDGKLLEKEPFNCCKDYSCGKDLLYDLWNKFEMFQTSCYLVHRKLIESAGPWLEGLKKNQDGEFFARVLLLSNGVYFCKEAEVLYRTGDYDTVSKGNSQAKIESLLNSFIQFKFNVLKLDDSIVAKKALALNFSLFRYLYNGAYPDLSDRAKEELKDLGVGVPIVGTKKVRRISSIIGYENFLRLRKLISNK